MFDEQLIYDHQTSLALEQMALRNLWSEALSSEHVWLWYKAWEYNC